MPNISPVDGGQIAWAARLTGVREVALAGIADLGWWRDHLGPLGLVPQARDGAAAVVVVAASARFRGIAFRELSVSVAIEPPPDAGGTASSALVGAYNSNRLFALAERRLFGAPYQAARVEIAAAPLARVRVARDGDVVFEAAMEGCDEGDLRGASWDGDGGWSGRVYLPPRPSAVGPSPAYFVARLSGATRSFPFDPARDAFALRPGPKDDALSALAASSFAPRVWELRPDAEHAKSRTIARRPL